MIYRVSHTTDYEYHDPVALSHHVLRLHPRELARQSCVSHEVDIEPKPCSVAAHVDYFGNAASVIEIDQPHTRLVLRSVSTVVCKPARHLDPMETASWDQVRNFSRGVQIGAALEASEFLYDSPLIKMDDAFAEYAAASFPKSRPTLAAVLDLTRRIHDDFTFDQEATTVSTPVRDVLKKRRGVCQDFAHLEIACLRSLGLPARYVSGYIETIAPPGKEKLVGSDASHAWISFYCPGLGWIDVDPTNNLVVSEQHITVAWGRDYSDISPVRGVILGSGEHEVTASVEVQKLQTQENKP